MEIGVYVYGTTELTDDLWEQNAVKIIETLEKNAGTPLDHSLIPVIQYAFKIGVIRAVSEIEKSLSHKQ